MFSVIGTQAVLPARFHQPHGVEHRQRDPVALGRGGDVRFAGLAGAAAQASPAATLNVKAAIKATAMRRRMRGSVIIGVCLRLRGGTGRRLLTRMAAFRRRR